jgi:hypothetical protein
LVVGKVVGRQQRARWVLVVLQKLPLTSRNQQWPCGPREIWHGGGPERDLAGVVGDADWAKKILVIGILGCIWAGPLVFWSKPVLEQGTKEA